MPAPSQSRSQERLLSYLSTLDRLGAGEFQPWAKLYARAGAIDRLQSDVDYLLARHHPERILNVGGAPYIFEHLMRQARPQIEIISLDLSPERFPHVEDQLGVQVRKLDIESASTADITALGRFDCIVFTEIFEHLRIDLLGTMRRLRDLLTDDGVLYLSTPNGLGLHGLKRLFLGRTGPPVVDEWSKLSRLGHMGHVREYSMREVREVLIATGYRIDHAAYRMDTKALGSLKARARNAALSLLFRLAPGSAGKMVVVARRA